MSTAQRQNSGIGVRTFDLSTSRDEELIRLRGARWIVAESVPDEANLSLGATEAKALNLENYAQVPVSEFDEAFLSNPAGSGTMKLVFSFERGIRVDENVVVEDIDSISATIDVSDRDARDLGDVDVTNRSGRVLGKTRVEDSGNTLIDPLDASSMGPYHARETSTGTYASINPGEYGSSATIVADTSGSATLTVEVSNDGSNWTAYTVSLDSSGGKEEVTGFAHIRAKVNQNLNSLEVSGKGV